MTTSISNRAIYTNVSDSNTTTNTIVESPEPDADTDKSSASDYLPSSSCSGIPNAIKSDGPSLTVSLLASLDQLQFTEPAFLSPATIPASPTTTDSC